MYHAVMWSETVGLRTTSLRPRKISLGLAGLLLCCETRSCVVILILKDTATFQVLFIVFLFCAWNITGVDINSGIYLLKR